MSALLSRLGAELRARGGLLGKAVTEDLDGAGATYGEQLAEARGIDYGLLIEEIREGYLLHRGASRLLRLDDPDLELLAGDRLYAGGLARLAALGDLHAVSELADVIALSAQALAAGDEQLAEAAWDAGVAAVASGPGELSDT